MKYNIDTTLSIREIDGEIFIFSRDSSTIHTLNGTGSIIFNEIKSGTDSYDIIQKIVTKYEISTESAENDMNEYISELEKKGIIKVEN